MQKARFLRRGDIIKYTSYDTEIEEVIRDVVIVLQMANGESISVSPSNEYELVPQKDIEEEPAITGDGNDATLD